VKTWRPKISRLLTIKILVVLSLSDLVFFPLQGWTVKSSVGRLSTGGWTGGGERESERAREREGGREREHPLVDAGEAVLVSNASAYQVAMVLLT
jgi:hypothetical protein